MESWESGENSFAQKNWKRKHNQPYLWQDFVLDVVEQLRRHPRAGEDGVHGTGKMHMWFEVRKEQGETISKIDVGEKIYAKKW